MAEETDSGEGDDRNVRRPNPMDVHVGSRVRLRRILLGMSQEKLGERLGLTFQQIQKYEKGVNRIGASRLFDMARVLGVQIQYFYDDAPIASENEHGQIVGFAERSGDDYLVEFLNSREGVELNRAFTRIADSRVRRSIIELVRAMAGDAPTAAPPI